MQSAGNSQDGSENLEKEIATVASILCKRKCIDWAKAKALTADIRPNRGGDDWPIEYLILWEDGIQTWELLPNLLNVKDMLRNFDDSRREEEIEKEQKMSKFNFLRKRSRKALSKGSFEKKHRIREVIGMRRNKFDNQLMCKVKWWPEEDALAQNLSMVAPTEGYSSQTHTSVQT